MLRMLLRLGPLLPAISSLWAGACIPDTLANYELLPPAGCTIGAMTVSGFTFSQSGTVQIGDTHILVTPQITTDFGLSFTAIGSPGFNVSFPDNSKYVIAYLEDPSGEIRSLDDVLTDPVTPPGVGRVNTVGCLGAAFIGNVCPTSNTVNLTVFDDGISPQLTATVNFAGQTMLGVQDTILLNTNGAGGQVSIQGFRTASNLPEPGTAWVVAAVLAGLLLLRGRFKRPQVLLQRRP